MTKSDELPSRKLCFFHSVETNIVRVLINNDLLGYSNSKKLFSLHLSLFRFIIIMGSGVVIQIVWKNKIMVQASYLLLLYRNKIE